MPKFPKGFGRRKSTANALEELQGAPVAAESSFKVLERPGHIKNSSFDGGIKLAKVERPASSPMQRGEDNIFAGMNRDRDSGGSNSNTTSTFTTDNSSRFSAASTAPSTQNSDEYSFRQDERVSHPDRTYDIPAQKIPRASSAFSLKAAGRTFSFGRGKGTPPPVKEEIVPPLPLDHEDRGAGRSRGTTTSSHASTATPLRLEEQELGLNLGGIFSTDMFADINKRKSTVMEANEESDGYPTPRHDTAEPPAKPLPAYSNSRANQPPPLALDRSRNIEPPQYSWASSHDSGRALIGATPSPPPVAYMNAPPAPPHGVQSESRGDGDSFASHARPQRPGGPMDSGLRRSSAFSGKRRSTLEMGDVVDEDAKLLRQSILAARQLSASPTEYRREERGGATSPNATPRPLRQIPSVSSRSDSEDMFDSSIAENAELANQLSEQALSPPPEKQLLRNKVMTPAQFERAKQDHERALISAGGLAKDDEDEDAYDEDEDEAERLKKIAKQRKMQDAHMAVFRQGMMKSTGETASPLPPRPNVVTSHSTPNLTVGGKAIDDDPDSDEEVPLAILQAHGFPNKTRPPSHLANLASNNMLPAPNQGGDPSSNNGSAMGGGGGNLPIFARNLPPDPYFGASVVNPLNRESLAFGGGAGSLRGGGGGGGGGFRSQGLVGIIANEEHARAMRRGSPSAGGEFRSSGAQPMGLGAMGMGMGSHPNMNMHQPMMNPMGPMMMSPMMSPQMMSPPMMPGMGIAPAQTQQDQIDFMRMQMHMQQVQQMQFMRMMSGGGPLAPGPANANQRTSTMTGGGPPTLQMSGIGQRPQSAGRTMSLMDPNTAPWRNSMLGYAPSIAPSERSNIGLPGRYRPVSQAGGIENSLLNTSDSRTPSPSGLGGVPNRWGNGIATTKAPSSLATTATTVRPTVKAVQREEQEEDEEAAWAAMKAKREKKKGFWKEKKVDDEIKGMLGHFE